MAYFFGREIRKELGVPVGLIACAKGATKIEAWMPPEAFKGDEETEVYYDGYRTDFEKAAAVYDPEADRERYRRAMKKFLKKRKSQGNTKGIRRPKPPHHPRRDANLPGSLNNGMVEAVVPYGIRGAIWYQGEKNSRHNTDKYERNLEALIRGWRKRWGQGAFPFYFVQLASIGEPGNVSRWVKIQDMQRRCLKVENTGMAVANDIGEANLYNKEGLPASCFTTE